MKNNNKINLWPFQFELSNNNLIKLKVGFLGKFILVKPKIYLINLSSNFCSYSKIIVEHSSCTSVESSFDEIISCINKKQKRPNYWKWGTGILICLILFFQIK